MRERHGRSERLWETVAFAISDTLGIGVSWFLCNQLLIDSSATVVAFASATAGLVGWLTAEGLGDAIILAVVAGAITALGLVTLPIPDFWRQVWLSAVVGVCTVKLGVGAYRELRPV